MAVSETLRSVIDAGQSSKRLDELSSARVIGKIALQVHAAQQKAGAGKAIGPITPGNIALSSNGHASFDATASGSTLGYSAPEQIAGGGGGDRRSDVFSLGAVMWEALTHTRLFDAMNDAAVKVAVQEREIAAPAEINANIPVELSAICMRALARNPTDRYQSLKAMAVEIEEFLEEAGYADDDSKIAQYVVGMGQPVPHKRSPLVSAAPAPAPQPSILTDKPVEASAAKPAEAPRAKRPSGADVAAALASVKPTSTAVGVPAAPVPEDWQDKPQPAHAPIPAAAPNVPLTPMPPVLPSASAPAIRADKATIAAMVPPQVKVATSDAPASATTNATPVDAKHADSKTDPTAEPKVDPKADPKQTMIGTAIAAPKADPKQTMIGSPIGEPKAPNEGTSKPESTTESKPASKAEAPNEAPNEATIASKAGTAPAPAAAASPPADDQRATLVDSNPPEAVLAAAAAAGPDKSAPPELARAASEADTTRPDPAAVVSLPNRESKGDLLAGWGWGTGKNDAVAPADYSDADDELEQPNNRKPLMYAIGGGLAIALLVTIIAFAAGGSNDKKTQTAKSTATQATAAKPDVAAAVSPAPEAPLPSTDTGSGSAAEPPAPAPVEPSVDPAAQAAADAAARDALAKQEQLAKEEAAKQAKADAAAKAEADKLAKQEAAAFAAEQKRLVREEAAKAEAERKRLAKEEADKKRLAREEARKQAAAKGDAKVARTTKTEPKATTKTTAKATPSKSVDVETAYRIGLQQFARGDTSGALASLRTSLAGNPNYAPTWRGLGLVFEKMGEKGQAKAAYRRYLQLAPSAGDAEIIRGRLERLGT